MKPINLTSTIVNDPDSLVGFKFYVKAGDVFRADEYAEAYRLNRADFDADDVSAVQAAAANLNAGEWLEVSHSIAA